ncbi:putative mobilization protein [Salinisphaera sp. S4-8]|uniref:plasmid mobilization protein n=1 Tax=Salinisphaera sp. S4-8 TaxID=633357 RepID=UPI003341F2C7
MTTSRFAFSFDEPRRARLKSYADAHGVSAAAVLKAIIDRLPATPDDGSEPRRPGPTHSQVKIRLTKPELDALDTQVQASGFESRTSWLTRIAIQALGRAPAITRAEVTELRRSRSELAAIGRNLNQIARALNIDSTNERPSDALITKTLELVDAHDNAIAALINKAEMRGQR